MAELLFGVETEYAVTGISPSGSVSREGILRTLTELARERLVQLPDLHSTGGVFLGNGGRMYVDCGLHPEICTPECANPWDAARYIQAGNRILAGLAAAVESACAPGTEILCFRGNVDYSGTQATWGCHELLASHPARHAATAGRSSSCNSTDLYRRGRLQSSLQGTGVHSVAARGAY